MVFIGPFSFTPDFSQLGFTDELREKYVREEIDISWLARVVREHKGLYTIQNTDGQSGIAMIFDEIHRLAMV
ncbi:MAG: hypothetical protein MI975_29420 [Cytophagales bacterium]|nr:hypothetical protein [Cytophagales bacterium]